MQNSSTLERDGVVIDVDAEPEAPPPPAAPPPVVKTGRGTAWFALLLALLALVAVGGGLLFGFQYWQAIKNDLTLLDAQLSQTTSQNQALQATISEAAIRVSEQQRLVEAQAGKLDQTFERQRDALQRQQAALEQHAADLAQQKLRQDERESQLRAAVAELHRRVGSNDTGWIVAEAEYLLRLADQRLRLAGDLDTARSALALADQRLRATGDPRWSGVRGQIAREIGALGAVVLPDVAGASNRLAVLIETVPELRLATATGKAGVPAAARAAPGKDATGEPSGEATAGEVQSGWRAVVDELWQGLKSSVRIQRRDQPVPALPAMRQRGFLYRNLELALESARLALVSGSGKLYRDSLSNALTALDEHFEPSDPRSRSMRAELQALAEIEIQPQMPDISDALHALQAEEVLQRSVLEVPLDAGQPTRDAAPGDTSGPDTAAAAPSAESTDQTGNPPAVHNGPAGEETP